MKKGIKILIVIIIFSGVVFGLYLFKLHSLAVEGNKIYEQRCLIVNPPLIAYKKSFLNFAKAVKNPKDYSSKEAAKFYIDYLEGIKEYLPEEDEWLKTQTAFINRWDFKLIEPKYIKMAGGYQLQMYQGYKDEAQATVDAMGGKITNEEFTKRFLEARDSRNKYMDLYNAVFESDIPITDWRQIFSSVPLPEGCNDANLIIPNTTGALDPDPAQVPVEAPEITG